MMDDYPNEFESDPVLGRRRDPDDWFIRNDVVILQEERTAMAYPVVPNRKRWWTRLYQALAVWVGTIRAGR